MASPIDGLFTLAGKIAVVTGGAGGIGAGIVTVLAEAGAAVLIADRDRDGAVSHAAVVAAPLEAFGGLAA